MKKLITILLLFIAGLSYGQLYVPAGNTLFTTNNGEITSKENVENNGTIYSVEMNSDSAQSISGTGSMRYLKANNSSDISLSSSHSITNNGITLTSGKIILGSYNLTAVSVTNDNATRYIKTSGSGVLRMNATTGAYTKFPIGNTTYNYVRIYNNNAAADTFSAHVQDTLYSNAGNSTGSLNNSVNRTWILSKTAANSGTGVNIEFNWNSGDVNGTLTNPVLYEYNGTEWVKANGTQSVSGDQITVTDYTGTLSSKQFMVSSSLGATVSVAASACQNATGINATFTGSGGTAPYTFTYTLNGGSNQTVTTTSGSSVTVSVSTASAGNQVFALVDVSDANLQNTVSDSATININQPTASTTAVSNCVSYTWNGMTYSVSGVFTASFTNAAGCDSVATLNLTIKQPTASTTAVSICVPYTWNGTTYTASGSYTWTGTNSIGCDSVATLNFTLRSPTSSSESETACDSYHWNDSTYTSSGTYTWTGTNAAGCDSVVTLNLTILASSVQITTASVCNSYTWSSVNGQTYTSSGSYTYTVSGCIIRVLNLTITESTSNTTHVTACDSYTWSVNGQTYYSGGNYTSISGCATEILNLTITPSTSSTTTESACDSYTWFVNGQTYTSSGSYTSVIGCATQVLNLNITASIINTTPVTACDSYTWSVNGQTYTSGGNYTSISDCATEILNLTIIPSTSSTTTASACDSYTWFVNGQTYTSSGSDTSVFGCATYILNLTITASTSNTTTASACDSYTWSSVNGQTYTTSGTYTYTGIGCNIEILNLTITASTSNTTSASACNSYTWSANGQTYTSSGSYTSVSGCANEILNLTINQPTTSTQSATACNSYIWNGTTYTTSGAKTWTGTNVAGCDSVATLNLTINVGTFNAETRIETSGYTWNGTLYAVSGTYTYSYSNSNGCNSVDTLYLTVNTNAGVNVKNVCTYIGTNETLIYTASVAGASSYAWSLPANTQLVSGQGTRSIAIKFLNGFAAQANKQIRVTPAGGSLQIIYTNVQAPVTPASIVASTTNICQSLGTNVPITFTIPRVYEQASNGRTTTSYIWTAQNGTTTISHPNGIGENDTTVAVTFDANFSTSSITVRSVNACGVSAIRSYLVSRSNPSVGIISGPTNSCEYIGTTGAIAIYSAPAVTNINSYTWTIPTGATNVSGQGTNTISFKYPEGYTGGSISVTGTNGCGTSAARTLSINRLLPGAIGNIDIINTQVCPNREFSYSLASIPGNATSLLWTVPAGGTLVSGQGTRSITVSYFDGVVNGTVTVKAVSNCGTSGIRSLIVKLAPCSANPGNTYTKGVINNTPSSMEVTVFPNPTTSLFNVKVTTSSVEKAKARLLDVQGRLIKTISINPNETITLGTDLKSGVYMLEVLQGEERKMVRVVKY